MAIYRGAGGAGDATNDATSQAILAAQSAQEAAASEAAAASSASSAATSASNAASSATSAASSATSAANSASSATTQAANAASSAATAATKASEAATSATNAASSATSAVTSATNASNSATAAANSATSASNSASAASTSASNAATYASNAATSATNAATSETNAAASANSASNSAISAAASATSAGNSASSATTSATNAASSASAAATSASNAATSETNAANSASSANTSATNAANSATAAANSATAAAGSATSASTSATNAASSATAAAGSATSAAASAAEAAATVTSKVSKAGDVMTGSLEVPTQASLKATALTRASIRPSLLLDFANTKQLDPRITFSRPTTATYYDGKTVVKAEENLLTYSQDFDDTGWNKQNASVIANSTTAPNGTSTADTLVESATTAVHNIRKFNYLVSSSTTYSASVFVKANGRSIVYIDMTHPGTANYRTWFDLSGSGSVLTSAAGNTGAITSVGNGWYRISVIRTTASGQTNQTFEFGPTTADNTTSYLGDGTSGIYLWGAQLEQRSTVTAYTPTTTAPITNYIPALQTAASGVARFDHDPVTGESKGLLIEEQRTNLLTYSDDLSNAAWTKSNATITANTVVAPDGSLTGDKIVETTTASVAHYVGVNYTTTAASYTFTVYAKAAERTKFELAATTDNRGASFDLANGTVSSLSGYTGLSGTGSITPMGNGWYKCSLTWTATAVSNGIRVVLINGTAYTYTGDGYSGLYLWGAQLEAGSFPTSYIPTVASQVTRSADSASMTGSNFSSWYRADEGTVYGEFDVIGVGSSAIYNGALSFDDGSTNNAMELSMWDAASDSLRWVGYSGGSAQWSITPKNYTTGFTKGIGVYKVNNFNGCFDAILGTEDTLGSVPVVNRLNIGCNRGGSSANSLNGHIKRIAYYPKRLSNAELQGITS